MRKDFPEYNLINKKKLNQIYFPYLLRSIIFECFIGIWIVLLVSIRTRVNLFPISFNIVHDYLTFKTIFETNKSKFLIQGKHSYFYCKNLL